jgi:hypothetical protein
MAKSSEFLIPKLIPPGGDALEYPTHDRANLLYNMWMSGATEDEIAQFYSLTVEEVKQDLLYVKSRIPIRQIISHNNDRTRILVQREQSESFRKLIGDSLAIPAQSFLVAGISPTGVLKEYRESVGMVQKAEPLIQVNTQQNFLGGGPSGKNGVFSAEDVIRKVLDRINQNENPPEEDSVIEAQIVTEDDQIPEDG